MINMKGSRHIKFQFNVLIIFVLCTVLSFVLAIHILNVRVANKKSSAKYTAESTIRRIQSEIDTYLVSIEILKNYILEYGEEELIQNFESLSQTMLDKDGIIKGIELAKDGVVSNIYPMEGNEEALGLNLLEDSNRRIEANLAKDTGEYTMAGPFGLRQSDEGALILNPIYIYEKQGKEFWGFSVIVIDWKKFREKIKLEKLEETGYIYSIWRNNPYGNDRYILAESSEKVENNAIKVPCTVPNDTWYVEIAPQKGWYAMKTMMHQMIMATIIPILGIIGIWMYLVNKQQENMYKIKLEHARNKAEGASEAKTRFLCNMSHDIRTPMNAVLGFTRMASENVTDVNIVKDSLRKIDIAGRHLLNLINDVLNVSRIESGLMPSNSSNINLYEFGEELIAIFEQDMKDKNINFNVNYHIKDCNVLCDDHHLREICVNLISNAMKFTLEGGTVECNITQLNFNNENECLYEIEIIDTGIGMSKEFQKVQYQLFERERNSTVSQTEGTGLGLPIVKRLVEMLKGKIICKSEIGKGTIYKLQFSFEVVDKEREELTKECDIVKIQGKKVLLVEDVELNREIAEYVLQNMGFEVESALDGKEAVNMITYAAPNYYDIVLMDIQMPVMNGYEATKKIRALKDLNKAAIPIFAMTANAFEEDKKMAMEVGMNGHFAKPIDVEKIYKVLREC